MISKLILASNNKHKIKEFKEILLPYNIEILSLEDIGFNDEIEENGNTFKENAFIKAKTIYDKYHFPVISDDSGLEVDALNGEPGIYSQRYSGGDSNDNINLLLKNLNGVNNRKANFICLICLYLNDNDIHYFEGKCFGTIAHERHGDNGFGYDPIFMVGDKSFADLDGCIKNTISHRANALKEFEKYLKDNNKL